MPQTLILKRIVEVRDLAIVKNDRGKDFDSGFWYRHEFSWYAERCLKVIVELATFVHKLGGVDITFGPVFHVFLYVGAPFLSILTLSEGV
jgi:hypothetical protein